MSLTADIIIKNAKIFTSDETNPNAEAVAVKGNRIVYVGDNAGVDAWKSDVTRLIDGQGHTLTPGFIDTHVHLLWGSIWMDPRFGESQAPSETKQFAWWMFCWRQGV